MADAAVADLSMDAVNGAVSAGEEFGGLATPPVDPTFFAQGMPLPGSDTGNLDSFSQCEDEVVLDDFDFDVDFCFDDILPASLEQPPLPDPAQFDEECFILNGSNPNLAHFQPDRSLGDVSKAFKATSAELLRTNSSSSPEPEICQLSGDQVSEDQGSGMNQTLGDRGQDVSGYLNVSSPESNGSKGSNDSRVLNCPSPESQGSGNRRCNVSEDSNKSVSSCPNFSAKDGVVYSKIKSEGLNSSKFKNALLKRKKESDDSSNIEVKTNKFHKSTIHSTSSAYAEVNSTNNVMSEEDEKKRARLMRNRESAQLSRQRKKHYVEELEDKVKSMHSTIQDLNAKISYFMAENATLRQQMGSGVAPPQMAGPAPGMYGHPPPMMYPWMPCGVPPYMVKPQGSQVPLVPIPRLKPQLAASAPRVNKKAEIKKSEGKTKKVASISFLGLLFFMLLFGGMVPLVNVKFGPVRESFIGGSGYVEDRFYEKHNGRVLTTNGNRSGTDYGEKIGENEKEQNSSVPLMASLYVPRNDRMVKIDGNLIIHSVLASEKAMASQRDPENKAGSETSLAVSRGLAHVVPVSGGRSPHLYRNPSERQRALGSTSVGNENLKSPSTDGRLQQWFREGLAGPMLSSGMCTEVFQFDVSAAASPGAIVPVSATSARNVTMDQGRNSTHAKKDRNRRILRGYPVTIPVSPKNISEDGRSSSQKENFSGNNSLTPMVVSVLVDPREVGDADVDGVMGAKSLSRIFVVVLMDSVKYVTYSCMLPFKGAGHHLVYT